MILFAPVGISREKIMRVKVSFSVKNDNQVDDVPKPLLLSNFLSLGEKYDLYSRKKRESMNKSFFSFLERITLQKDYTHDHIKNMTIYSIF